MADEAFRIEGVVELVADEKSIEAIADDTDKTLSKSRPAVPGKKTSPVAPGGSVGRDALTGASGAAFAKQIGGEVGKVQEKTARGAGAAISPVTAGIIGGKIAKIREPGEGKQGDRGGFQRGVASVAVSGNLKGGLLSVLKSPRFLAATAIVGGAVIAASLPKIAASVASGRLNRLVGLPGAEFSPELSALALQRTIRQRLRTQEVGRIRGASASELAQSTDNALDRLARIGAALGVAVDRILKWLLDTLDPLVQGVEFILRSLGLLGPGATPASLNMPVNLLFGALRAGATNRIPPSVVRP